jgi:hypothetical protein
VTTNAARELIGAQLGAVGSAFGKSFGDER